MEPTTKAIRWKQYFVNLLNCMIPDNPIPHTKNLSGAPCIESLKLKEVETAIRRLKIGKPQAQNCRNCRRANQVRREETSQCHFQSMSRDMEWRENARELEWSNNHTSKKGDRTDCNYYRDIVLLNTVLKVFPKILLAQLIPYSEECLVEYQCVFRKGQSTIEHLAIIGQIIENKYEYRQNMWQVFIDFKKAYDSVHRVSLYNIMNDFGFLEKCIKLT